MPSTSLPSPCDEHLALSHALLATIAQQCQQRTALSFYDYMQIALYHPQYGYYQNTLPKLGATGDFITAPTLSPVFAYCLAHQCQTVLSQLNSASILEFGAGNGSLAATLLNRLAHLGCPIEHYYILEVSAFLRQQQQATIRQQAPEFYQHITWLTELPSHFSGVILANEVLDAMPCHRFKINARGQLSEQYVHIVNHELQAYYDKVSSQHLASQIQALAIQHRQQDYESEIQPNITGWINSVADCLQQGLLLVIDYGFPQHEYYHSDRNQGTLMCHYQHHSHPNPLLWPGLQDISCHINFTALAQAGLACGLQLAGYTTQGSFLIGCGLTEIASELQQQLDIKAWYRCSQAIKCLTLPHEMGELFKVMGLTKDLDSSPTGFSFHDQREKLLQTA